MAHSQAPVSTKPPFAIEIGPLAKSEEELADEGRIMSDKGRLSDWCARAMNTNSFACFAVRVKKSGFLFRPLLKSLLQMVSNYWFLLLWVISWNAVSWRPVLIFLVSYFLFIATVTWSRLCFTGDQRYSLTGVTQLEMVWNNNEKSDHRVIIETKPWVSFFMTGSLVRGWNY